MGSKLSAEHPGRRRFNAAGGQEDSYMQLSADGRHPTACLPAVNSFTPRSSLHAVDAVPYAVSFGRCQELIAQSHYVEPALLLPSTSSMTLPCAPDNYMTRRDIACDVVARMVERLSRPPPPLYISQTVPKQDGLSMVSFGGKFAADFGLVDNEALPAIWRQLSWTGEPWVVPGWHTVSQKYITKYVHMQPSDRPLLLLYLLLDSIPLDIHEFVQSMEEFNFQFPLCVVVGLLGYGPSFDTTMAFCQTHLCRRYNVIVAPFAAETNPEIIASFFSRFLKPQSTSSS